MQPETPAQGILKRHDWGNARSYHVTCSCMDDDHSHDAWIEANEDGEVSVVIYTTTTTPFWSMSRWHQIWHLLTRGHVKSEVALSMTEQQALNYAATLQEAVQAVPALRQSTDTAG